MDLMNHQMWCSTRCTTVAWVRVIKDRSSVGHHTCYQMIDCYTVPAWRHHDCQGSMIHGWHYLCVIGWSKYSLGMPQLRCILDSRDRWEFQLFIKGHWQSPWTDITAGLLAMKGCSRWLWRSLPSDTSPLHQLSLAVGYRHYSGAMAIPGVQNGWDLQFYDDIMQWKCILNYWPFVRGITEKASGTDYT